MVCGQHLRSTLAPPGTAGGHSFGGKRLKHESTQAHSLRHTYSSTSAVRVVVLRGHEFGSPPGAHKAAGSRWLPLEMYPSAAHGDVDGTTNNEWSDRDLQVFDLKAAVTLSSTCVIEAGQTGSQSNMLAVPFMHHAPSRGHRRRLRGGRQSRAIMPYK